MPRSWILPSSIIEISAITCALFLPYTLLAKYSGCAISFGFKDGISQPAVQGVNTHPHPGQETVRQGIILLGRDGDAVTRPSWALDGSFLALRYLFQLVPEFDTFLRQNPITSAGLSEERGSELLGARLVGRWKSGTLLKSFFRIQ